MTKIFKRLFILITFIAFISCSDDEASDCSPELTEISGASLGTYTGLLTLNGTEVFNQNGTATLVETSCKTYRVDFSDDVSSIEGVTFIANSDNTVFTYTNSNATTTVVIDDEGDLSISQTVSSLIVFTGSK
ncbi:hypothetical protein [Ekhidna sp.]